MRAVGLSIALAISEPAYWQLRTVLHVLRARIAYPMDIEWMEGAWIYHAYRLLHGLPIYGDPSSGFASYSYPPMQLVLVAAVGSRMGLDYAAARLVSAASFVLVGVLLGFEVLRHSTSKWFGIVLGLLTTAAIAATYPLVEGTWDLARCDATAIAFAVVAAAIVGEGRLGWPRTIAAGLAIAAAVFTKQTTVFFGAWIVLYLALRDLRSAVRVASVTALLGLLAFVWLEWRTGGWFHRWMSHYKDDPRFYNAGRLSGLVAILVHAPFVVLLSGLVAFAKARRVLRPRTILWCGMLCAAIPASVLPLMKRGGWVNNVIPLITLVWPATMMTVSDLMRLLERRPVARFFARIAVLVVGEGLLSSVRYDPAQFEPSAAEIQQATKFCGAIGKLKGGVLVPIHPFLGVRCTGTANQISYIAKVDAVGIDVDYADEIKRTGARWVIVSDRPDEQFNTRQAPFLVQRSEIDTPLDTINFRVENRRWFVFENVAAVR